MKTVFVVIRESKIIAHGDFATCYNLVRSRVGQRLTIRRK
jgi:hypothetical protein